MSEVPWPATVLFLVPFFIVLVSLFTTLPEEYKVAAIPVAILAGIGGLVVWALIAERVGRFMRWIGWAIFIICWATVCAQSL
ncbi:MAG: hypothetical protein PVF15_00135 [Candidatus Bathyarchaeota archaeon]